MTKTSLLSFLLCLLALTASAEKDSLVSFRSSFLAGRPEERRAESGDPHYKMNWPVDAAITIPCAVWSIYAFPQIYSKPEIDSLTLINLKKEDIPAFDRWAVKHSDKADEVSNIAFYASMPYPFILFLDKSIRKEAGKVSALYLEAMSITGLLYTGGDYFIDRYRPEVYDETKDFGQRKSGNGKNSFFAGHVALVATSTFFTASIYDEFHPDSKLKWAFYGVAVAATGTTIYLRHMAGKHFPSDIVVGTIIGVGSGMLVPRLHKYKPGKKQAWHVSPTIGQGFGFSAVYKF